MVVANTAVLESDLWGDLSTQILHPSVWSREVICVRNCPSRFDSLLSWEVVNRILEEHALPSPRLRLFNRGSKIDVRRYQETRRDGQTGLVRAAGLYRELSQGATLALDSVEELWSPLRDFADGIEKVFRVHVNINLFATFGSDSGFDLHSDDANLIILQLTGRKDWKVWQPERNPVSRVTVDSQPSWEGILTRGDMLHVPRGWPHVVRPLSEPTLHLTVNVPTLTGLDLLKWFVARLGADNGCVQKDAPILDTMEQQLSWVQTLKEHIDLAWSSDLLSHFIAYIDGATAPRPHVHLPHGVQIEHCRLRDAIQVKLLGVHPIHFEGENNGQLCFAFAGRKWSIAPHLRPLLTTLNDGHYHLVSDLFGALNQSEHAELEALLGALFAAGTLAIA